MNVLIVEDNRVARKSLEASLVEWGYDVITCSNGTDALRLLTERDPPGLAILDWMIPGMDGIEVCRKVRESRATPFVYILIVTGKGKSADVVAALEAGADDYLTKPFDASELRVRMRAGERIVRLQQELRFKADHDALTGLWNHKTIIDFLGRELSRAQREGTSVAVFVVDLDHFKQINDTYGHLVGDEVLREAVGRMVPSMRPYDLIGRYGGDEFLVVLPVSGAEQLDLSSIAERLRERVAGAPLETSAGQICVKVSVGAALAGDGESWNAETLIELADERLYRAKRAGRNRVEVMLARPQPRTPD